MKTKPLKLFYSYSHGTDEELRDELDKHLKLMQREGLIAPWHDRKITGGTDWDRAIRKELMAADIILFLVSADFMASDYIWDVEVAEAMKREASGMARVIPVVLRACEWTSAPFGKLQSFPKDIVAVTSWPNRDEAFANVAKGLRAVVAEMTSPPKP